MNLSHGTMAVLAAGALVLLPFYKAEAGTNAIQQETESMTAAEQKGFHAVQKYLSEIGRIESAGLVKAEGREVTVFRFRIAPTPQSCIRIGISLPKHSLWTGKLIGLGNSGFPSRYSETFYNWKFLEKFTGITQHLIRNNHVVVTTDMGSSRHQEKNPEVWKDFGFRSTHFMTVIAKEVIRLFYDRPAEKSYFFGISTGGGQGMHEAQKFPEDYDGIIAVVPVCGRIQSFAEGYGFHLRTHRQDGTGLITAEQLDVISEAAVTYFRDKGPAYASGKFVVDPRYEKKAAEEIARIAAQKDLSLAGELQKKIPVIFEDVVIGGRKAAAGRPFGGSDFRLILDRPFTPFQWYYGKEFDARKYDFNKEFPKMAEDMGVFLNAENPDMSAFRKRGGKLIMFAGTEDCLISCSESAWFYERAAQATGGYDKLKEFCLYYQLPGRSHCHGRGIRFLENIEQRLFDWCEKGIAPDVLCGVTEKGEKYPVYPYPMTASGDKKSGYKPVPITGLPSVQPDPVYTRFITAQQAAEECRSKGQKIRYPEGKTSLWHGFLRHDFEINGHKAFIVEPKNAAPGRPWTWCMQHPENFVFRTPVLLLKAGYHHVHLNLDDTRMNDDGIRIAKEFYDLLQSLYLNPKGALIGLGDGGLFSFRWAAEYPKTVSSIYADAPATALINGKESKVPNNSCGIIAKAKIPVFLVRHGQDQISPGNTHCDIFVRNFRKAGGKVIVKDLNMNGHHPYGLDNPREITDFILQNEF